jgi:nucleotide-binding universal stress UspA family protein
VSTLEHDLAIRRILVALDASTNSLAALEAAAELAANLEAELIGLFVEDVNLLHLAGLPFAHEVRPSSAVRQRMSSDQMEQDLKLQASQARRALEAAAERVKVRWRFNIVRGQVTAAVLEAALEADLLALGRVSRPLSRSQRLGSTARAATAGPCRSVLLMPQNRDLNHPVLVTYDGSAAAHQALSAAARLARYSGDDLNVLLLSDSLEESRELKNQANEWLAERNVSAEYHWLPQATVGSLSRLVQAAQNCILVLGGENELLKAESIQELLDHTDCPVMLVR